MRIVEEIKRLPDQTLKGVVLPDDKIAELKTFVGEYEILAEDNRVMKDLLGRATVIQLLKPGTEADDGTKFIKMPHDQKWHVYDGCDGDCLQDHPGYDSVVEAYKAAGPYIIPENSKWFVNLALAGPDCVDGALRVCDRCGREIGHSDMEDHYEGRCK